jgi:hypothetical protein
VHVRVDAAGQHQQATGVDLLGPGQGAADLGDPAVPHADVSDLAVAGSDDRSVTDDEVEGRCNHQSILAPLNEEDCGEKESGQVGLERTTDGL